MSEFAPATAPVAVPGSEPQGTPGVAPVIQPAAPVETPASWEPQIAELRGQMTGIQQALQTIAGGITPQAPAPQAPAKTVAQLIAEAKLPDPVTAESGEAYNAMVAEKLGSVMEQYVSQSISQAVEKAVNPLAEQLRTQQGSFQQQQQQTQLVADFKRYNPEYANIPDNQVLEGLRVLAQESALIEQHRFKGLGSAFAQKFNIKPTPTTQPVQQQPDPGAASLLPAGTTDAQVAQLKEIHTKLTTVKGFAAELATTPEGRQIQYNANLAARQFNW